MLALSACTPTTLDPLEGIFPAATEPVLTTLAGSSFEKTSDSRIFTFRFSGENGAALDVALVGTRSQYYLEPGVYGPGTRNLCFLTDGRTSVNGRNVADGQISVSRNGDVYRFIFVLFDTEGKAYRTQWQGELLFEADPEPVALTQVLSTQANDGTVTLNLATSGISTQFDPATWSTVYSGSGNYLAVDFYSADGYLHEGVYGPSAAGGVVQAGEYGIGWDPGDLWGIGIVFENWGTCWWTVNDGATSAEKITGGNITVEKKGSKFIITWGDETTYPRWARFEGAIDALDAGDGPSVGYTFTESLSDASDESFQPVAGVKIHNLVLSDASGTEVAWFDLVLAEGTADLSGEYTCKEYAHEDHTFGNGYDLSMWGMGMGGSRYAGADGATVLVQPGETLSVSKLGEGIYSFEGSTGYVFVAQLAD